MDRESKVGVPEKSRTISRADVAHFVVKALSDEQYENSSVGIATYSEASTTEAFLLQGLMNSIRKQLILNWINSGFEESQEELSKK